MLLTCRMVARRGVGDALKRRPYTCSEIGRLKLWLWIEFAELFGGVVVVA